MRNLWNNLLPPTSAPFLGSNQGEALNPHEAKGKISFPWRKFPAATDIFKHKEMREREAKALHTALQNTPSWRGQIYQTASQGLRQEKLTLKLLFSLVSCCQGQAVLGDIKSGHLTATNFGKQVTEV